MVLEGLVNALSVSAFLGVSGWLYAASVVLRRRGEEWRGRLLRWAAIVALAPAGWVFVAHFPVRLLLSLPRLSTAGVVFNSLPVVGYVVPYLLLAGVAWGVWRGYGGNVPALGMVSSLAFTLGGTMALFWFVIPRSVYATRSLAEIFLPILVVLAVASGIPFWFLRVADPGPGEDREAPSLRESA